MIFTLEISRDNSPNSYYPVDLFPNQQLDYDVDFYDSLDVNQIKLPFSSSMKIPLTDLNKSANRFNYNPLTDTQDLFPKNDFYFKITVFGSTNVNIEGILNVKSIEYLSDEPYIDVELNDFVSKYISDLKDTTIAEVYDADTTSYGTYYRSEHTFSDFFNLVGAGGERGIIGQNPADRPIIFPYIDFCNDVEGKFGYGARQFTEYGTGMDRAGIVPSFSVKNFLTTIGYWLTSQGFNTRVDSRLFALNYTEAIPDFEVEKLQMLLPCKLEADQATNTRVFHLNQAPFWTGTNENLSGKVGLDGNDKDIISNYFFNMETFGNFGSHTTDPEDPNQTIPVTSQTDYGLDVTNAAYPEGEAFGNERGYFAPFMSFNADIDWDSGNPSANITLLDYEIPILAEDDLVYQLETQDENSDMTFGVFVGLWENGELVKKIRMQDANGDDVVLTCAQATTTAGYSTKAWVGSGGTYHFFEDEDYDRPAVFASTLPNVLDMMRWNLPNLNIELYIPEGTEVEISGESRYGTNYFVEPLQGNLVGRVANSYLNQGTGATKRMEAISTQQIIYSTTDIRKAITRTEDYGRMDIRITANSNFNPYFDTDKYTIKESLENTCTVTPLEVLTAICKRFGCGIFYEQSGSLNILRVDPLHLVRSGSQSINNLVDDLKSVKVLLGGDKIKNLSINNKDYGLYYDDEDDDGITIGSTTQEINPDGVSDLEIDLKSSIYYNSVCGEQLFQAENENLINGVVSSKEVAFTPNLFTKHQDIGIRFAYVDKPLYRCMIKIPHVVNSEHRPNILTVTQRIYLDWQQHIFNGRLRHINIQGFNLMAEDELGDVTDYYSLISANEKIRYSGSPTIEFDMVLQTSELSSLDFFFKTLSCTRINQSDILVKSAEGEVFEDYAYLTIKGLLQ